MVDPGPLRLAARKRHSPLCDGGRLALQAVILGDWTLPACFGHSRLFVKPYQRLLSPRLDCSLPGLYADSPGLELVNVIAKFVGVRCRNLRSHRRVVP